MEYKIGDLVRVKRGLIGWEYYDGLFFNTNMEKYRGNIYKICAECDKPDLFRLDTDQPSRWKFNSAMVEPVTEIKFSNEDIPVTELEF